MILLDTHVLLWIVTGEPRIGARTTDAVRRAGSVFASAVSYVELDLRSRRRALVVPPDFPRLVGEQGIKPLPLTEAHVAGLRALPALDGPDPLDRMLLAQAQIERHTFATADPVLLDLGLPWVVDATE